MTTWVVRDSSGAAVSIGTVLAHPLPAGCTATALSVGDADRLANGGAFNPVTGAVGDPPLPPPDPTETRITELEAEVEALTMALIGVTS